MLQSVGLLLVRSMCGGGDTPVSSPWIPSLRQTVRSVGLPGSFRRGWGVLVSPLLRILVIPSRREGWLPYRIVRDARVDLSMLTFLRIGEYSQLSAPGAHLIGKS